MRYRLDDAPFAGRTGAGVTVAVIDSGVHPSHPHVGAVDGGASMIGEDTDWIDRLGHGTAVAAAIREKAPGVKLLAVKVFHDRLATSADALARAIEWAAREGAQVINLSLGTHNEAHAERLSAALDVVAARGAFVVSALGAREQAWFPGALPGACVIGVTIDETCERDEIEVAPRSHALPAFAASPYPRPIPNVPRERNVSGISFAVANVTGFVARAIEASGATATADVLRGLATPA